MPPALTPSSSAHSHPMPSKGVKRPRKGNTPSTSTVPLSSQSPLASGSVPSVGPKDIIVNGKQKQQVHEDEGNVYSATPPNKPTKKLSTGLIGRHSRKDSSSTLTDHVKQEEDYEGSSAARSSSSARSTSVPVKSALASSARLLAGPPGGSSGGAQVSAPMATDRYKRSMYTSFVDNAFTERDRGSTKAYWDLVSQFRSSALSSSNPSGPHSLSLWLLALSHHVSKLDVASHSQLVENILDLPWAGASDDFCKSWCRFVCALVSARTEWVANLLNRIVKAFRWRSDWLPLGPLNQPTSSTSTTTTSETSASPLPTRRLLYTRTHLLLRAILTLVPTSVSTLNGLLVKHFPHRREGKREQAAFVRNILFITQYEGQVAETVWRVVADRAIGLDVEIQIELDELEEQGGGGEGSESGAGNEGVASDLDPFDRAIDEDDSSEGSDSDDEDGMVFDDLSDEDVEGDNEGAIGGLLQEGEDERKERKVRELVDKLDALMKVCFEHLETMGTVKAKKTEPVELVLDPRPSWLNEFLGTAASSSGNVTPTLERPQTFALKEEDLNRSSPEVDEEFEATKDALFHHLLQLFSRSILPTFKCRHVQFLLFWYCSLETDFADFFLGFLIHKAIYARSGTGGFDDEGQDASSAQRERAEPLVLRQASASYVASFVSRAHYITPTYTRTVVLNLCSYLEAHLEAHSNAISLANSIGLVNIPDERTRRLAVAPPGSEDHAIWYAVAQAVFYIFCFRWQDLKMGGGINTGASMSTGGKASKTESVTSSIERDLDEYEVDGGLIIGSLSSTGSSSYAHPSSFHREHPSTSHPKKLTSGNLHAPISSSFNSSSSFSSAQNSSFPSVQLDVPHLSTEGLPGSTSAGGGGGGSTPATWSQGLSILQRAILSPLNPLQHCSSIVVRQFASVAQHVGFLYCWSIIEANRRSAGGGAPAPAASVEPSATSGHRSTGKPDVGGSGGGGGIPSGSGIGNGSGSGNGSGTKAFLTKDLEGFFPFDPYRLSSTAERFVSPLYREWKDVAPAGLGGEEEEEEDEEEEEEEEEEEGDDDDTSEADSSASASASDDDDEDEEGTTAAALQRPSKLSGLQIPGSSLPHRHRHHRHRQGGAQARREGSSTSTSTSADQRTNGRGGQGAAGGDDDGDDGGDGDGGIEEGLEAMSVSAS